MQTASIHLASLHSVKPWHMHRYDDSLLSGLFVATIAVFVLAVIAAALWHFAFPNSTARTVFRSATIALTLTSSFALGGWTVFLAQDRIDARTVQQAASQQLGLSLGLDGRGTDSQGKHWRCFYTYAAFLHDGLTCSGVTDNGVTVNPIHETHTLTGYFSK